MSETNPPPQHANRIASQDPIRRHALTPELKRSLRNQTWTFIRKVAAAPASWRSEHLILGGSAVLLTVLVGVIMPTFASATRSDMENSALTTLQLPLPPLPASASADAAIASLAADAGNEPDWKLAVVKSGQSLSDSSGSLRALRFDRSDAARVILKFATDKVTESVQDRALERRVEVAHGVINSSLFEAGDQAGMSDLMTLRLANAFGYDIDFAQDLRVGDSFSVIYDQVYRDGERLHGGDIIAATFTNQGKRFTAIRYTNAKGETLYYTEDGRPLRKAFLRTPVEFTRISSKFSVGRMHPILGKMRAHRGVDYAAPSGTPIRAAGAGKIIFRGTQSGYGNVVILQHQGKFTTLYGHMSRFAAGKVGQSVSQGQVIGYVGMTGLATGPHLHYEFRLNGQHRDPLTVTLPKEEPLPASELARFNKGSGVLLARLKMVETVHLARQN